MLSGLSLTQKLSEKKSGLRILVLGTGAGLLPMFLKHQLGDKLKEIVTVDISEEMLKIARDYFGFREDSHLKSVIADAYQYVQEYKGEKFDIIFNDINYEEENLLLSPPKKFIEPAFLEKLLALTTDEGFVTFNLLCYDKATKEQVFGLIQDVKNSHNYYIDGEEEVNRVVHLLKSQAPAEDDARVANMEKVLKDWNINKGLWLKEMRIQEKIMQIKEVKQ